MEKFLLGTYTRKESQGIYEGTLDVENKTLLPVQLVQKEKNPTYLTTDGEILYTVGTNDDGGGLMSYEKTSAGDYQLINAVTKPGNSPCYVAVDQKRQLVYSANYHLGDLRSYKILKNGGLELADEVLHEGSGPHANQEKPHVHYTDLAPDNRLIACDLGTDGVYTYDVAEDGKLTEVAVFNELPGTGPRHLVFHPKQSVAYLVGELAGTVTVLQYFSDGHFESLQTISTLPADFTGENSGGAIRISQDGRFLYASNRGHNSIAIFAINENGTMLALVAITDSHGDFPRDFNFSKNDQFLICAHQKSDHLSLFEKNSDGTLTFLENSCYAPEAVCVHFPA